MKTYIYTPSRGAMEAARQIMTADDPARFAADFGAEQEQLDMAELIDRAMKENPAPRVLVVCDGGLVQHVLTESAIDCSVLDYDQEGADPDDTIEVPQGDGTFQTAGHSQAQVDIDPERIASIINDSKPTIQ